MTWWEFRRIGWRRYEVRSHPSCLGGLVYGTAAVVIGAGVLVRIAPLLLDQAHARRGHRLNRGRRGVAGRRDPLTTLTPAPET